jgi:NitT/TauT family transport system substrate-binding protein
MILRGRLTVAALAVIACAAVLGACGGGGASEEGGDTGKPVTLKVGVIPIADVAPLYVGMKQGFFKQEKLTIKPTLAEGGAQIVAGTVSGGFDIGFSNVTSLLIAASKKVPVNIIATGVLAGDKPDAKSAFDGLMVKKDSPIKSLKDLEGKTVSVNTLANVGPLSINRAMEKAGADYKKIKYVEVPFPEAISALNSGRVDAAWVVEPFVSQGKSEGDRSIAYTFEEVAPKLTVATYFATTPYIEKNKDVVARFRRAINKSLEYSEAHPDVVRKVVLTYTKIPPPAAKGMVLPHWQSDMNRPTIETTSQLAKKYGFLKEEPNLDDLIKQD